MHRLRGAWPREVPVDPDAPEARDWLVRELANPEYEAARPTWFDLLAQRVVEWFESLRFTPGEGGFPWWLVILVMSNKFALSDVKMICSKTWVSF